MRGPQSRGVIENRRNSVCPTDPWGPYMKDVRKNFGIFDPPLTLCPHITKLISTVRPQNLTILKPPLSAGVLNGSPLNAFIAADE